MLFSLLPVSLLLSLAAAQTTTFSASSSTSTICGAQPVLEACLASTEAIATSCASTDYNCLCSKWNDVLTCFNQCPNDARLSGVQNSKASYCAYASVNTSSTTSVISRDPSSTATTTGGSTQTTNNADVRTSGSSSGTATGAAASASASGTGKSGASKDLVVGAGSVMMGLAGLVGAFL